MSASSSPLLTATDIQQNTQSLEKITISPVNFTTGSTLKDDSNIPAPCKEDITCNPSPISTAVEIHPNLQNSQEDIKNTSVPTAGVADVPAPLKDNITCSSVAFPVFDTYISDVHAQLSPTEIRMAVSRRASSDADFDPDVRRHSRASAGSDEEFAPSGMKEYGGIIRLGRQWHGVSPVTDGCIASSNGGEDLFLAAQTQCSNVLENHALAQANLRNDEFEKKIVEASQAVAAVYFAMDGPLIETAMYVGIRQGQHIALTCAHGAWRHDLPVYLCFNTVLPNNGFRGGKWAIGRCIAVHLDLDLAVIQITDWKFPVPLPINVDVATMQVPECVWCVVYHGSLTPASFEKYSNCYESLGNAPDINEANMLLRPLQKSVSPGAYTGEMAGAKLVTCTLFHGGSGGPVFVLRDNQLVAALRVQAGFYTQNRNAVIPYSLADWDAIQKAVSKNMIIV